MINTLFGPRHQSRNLNTLRRRMAKLYEMPSDVTDTLIEFMIQQNIIWEQFPQTFEIRS